MLLQGRRGLIIGIANERSLAYGIARAARSAGAELALTYQNARLQANVEGIGAALGADRVLPCDLTHDAELAHVVATLQDRWGRLDFVVHAVASARREDLEGRFIDTPRDGFAMALDVSTYSLVALARATEELLAKGASPSILALTYFGSEQAVPHYNVMGVAKAALEASVRYLARDLGPRGVRVNALSAGPVKTLSAAGIRGLRTMLAHVEQSAPLRRNIGLDDVGGAALFALSDLGSGMTGEVFHVDAGYHIVGAPGIEVVP